MSVSLHFRRTGGAGPPLVMLHGLMGSGATWGPLARPLEDAYDLVMPDARGHGQSPAPEHGYRYEDHAGDVIGLIDALRLESPVLLGHSMGGLTAAVVASRRAVRGLILVDPTFLSPERQREVHSSGVLEQHRRLVGLGKSEVFADLRSRHPNRSEELCERLAEARLQVHLGAFEVLTPPNPDYRQLIRSITAPALLVIADGGVVSPEVAAELQRLHPRLQVEQIPESGHGVPFDQPERLASVVRAFLGGLACGTNVK